MKAYKGFKKDMTCRGFQFEEGKTYEEEEAKLCECGFHACENPQDCYSYHAPGDSVYHEVELDDNGERNKDNSKVVGKKIKIGARLSVAEICKLHFNYVKERTTTEYTDPKLAAAGDYGSAAAGDCGSAAAGNCGSAVSGGKASVGKDGIAVVRGNNCRVRGDLGSVILVAEEEKSSCKLQTYIVAVVDGKIIKANTWYTLKDGEFVEVPDDES